MVKVPGADEAASAFLRSIDKEELVRIACSPDDHPEDRWCAWEFTIVATESRRES